MQSISVFLDITKLADFQLTSAECQQNVSRILGVCHPVHIFFGSSLGKV